MMKIETGQKKVNAGLNKIQAQGGKVNFTGPDSGEVYVKGVKANFEYDRDEKELIINITDTHFIVSTSYVEDKIREYFD